MANDLFNNVKLETPKKTTLTLKSFGETNNRLVFSFDKENFDNFECNISDNMLDHDFLTKPMFGLYAPLGNSLGFFRTLYQHSLKKHDEEYREIIKKLFNISRDIELGNEHKTFEDYCSMEDKRLKKFLSKNDAICYLFSVDEYGGKIIYRENVSVTITSCEVDFCILKRPEKDIRDAMIDFLIKFNEMYLQGFLGTAYLKSLTDLNDKYAKRSSDLAAAVDEQAYTELFELFSKVDHLLQQNYKFLADMSVEDRRRFYDKQFLEIFNKNNNSFIMSFLVHPFPKYLNFLIGKVISKALFYYSDNSDIFSLYSPEHIEILIELKNHFKKNFERLDLSEKSIENLVMFFLEDNIK